MLSTLIVRLLAAASLGLIVIVALVPIAWRAYREEQRLRKHGGFEVLPPPTKEQPPDKRDPQ